jgi:hypothetical protein
LKTVGSLKITPSSSAQKKAGISLGAEEGDDDSSSTSPSSGLPLDGDEGEVVDGNDCNFFEDKEDNDEESEGEEDADRRKQDAPTPPVPSGGGGGSGGGSGGGGSGGSGGGIQVSPSFTNENYRQEIIFSLLTMLTGAKKHSQY